MVRRRKKKVWKGGPRSSRSYTMDMHRQSKEPWEQGKVGKRGVTSVRPHYRKKKRGGSTKVKHHRRRISRKRRR